MPTPQPTTYSVAASPIVGGRWRVPAWARDLAEYAWHTIPNSQFDQQPGSDSARGIFAYSGGSLKASGSEMFLVGGGHADSHRNEVWSIKLGLDVPIMSRLAESTPIDQVGWLQSDLGGSHYLDGRPASRHTYWQIQFVDSLNLLVFPGAPAVYGNGNASFPNVDAFDPETNQYLPANTFGSLAIQHYSTPTAKDSLGNIWQHSPFSGNLARWSPSVSANGAPGTSTNYGSMGGTAGEMTYQVHDSKNILFRTGKSTPAYSAAWYDLDNAGAVQYVTLQGEPSDVDAVRLPGQLAYDTKLDCFWYWARGNTTLYKITVTGEKPTLTFTVTVQQTTGTVTTSPTDYYGAGYGRFAYAPELRGLVWWHTYNQPVRFIRTS